jgi:hypothetical protein
MSGPLDVVKAALQAYVDKDRACIEALIADDYHFTSPIDNALTGRRISSAAGRIAKRRPRWMSSMAPRAVIWPGSSTKGLRMEGGFAIRSYTTCRMAGSSRQRSTLAGRFHTRQVLAASSRKAASVRTDQTGKTVRSLRPQTVDRRKDLHLRVGQFPQRPARISGGPSQLLFSEIHSSNSW